MALLFVINHSSVRYLQLPFHTLQAHKQGESSLVMNDWVSQIAQELVTMAVYLAQVPLCLN